MSRTKGTEPAVAVVGATGHTGGFVIAELLRRGIMPIAIARDAAALVGAPFPQDGVLRRQALLDDAGSIDRAFAGAAAVINCAGPFLDTAGAVAAGALRAGVHYLDVSAEQASTSEVLDKYDRVGRDAGVVLVPAMGFYGGFADLLVTAALGDWERADSVEVMIGLDSWHPTRGTRITGAKNKAERMVIAGGQLAAMKLPPAKKFWAFGDPLGQQTMIEVPFSEVILIERHLKTAELHTYLSSVALDDIRNAATPAPKAVDARGRSTQHFAVDVVASFGGKIRRITAQGRDIYAFSAPLVCEAVVRLLDGRFHGTGAGPAGAIFDAGEILAALSPEHLTVEMKAA